MEITLTKYQSGKSVKHDIQLMLLFELKLVENQESFYGDISSYTETSQLSFNLISETSPFGSWASDL